MTTILRDQLTRRTVFCLTTLRCLLLSLLTVSITNVCYASPARCPQRLAREAIDKVSDVNSWDGVFRSFKKYKRCDDGAVAEGFSASIANLLADQWEDVGEFSALSRRDRGFNRFVISHVDETMNLDQAVKIKRNVKYKCPAKVIKVCHQIRDRFLELDN
jgi:hypothetical protein